MDEVISDLLRKIEVINTPERDKTPSANVQVADQDNYQYAHQKEKTQNLEDAERGFIHAVVEVSGTYDRQIPTILGEDSVKRTDVAQQLQDHFEEAVRDLNPKGNQLPSESGSVEVIEPREALEHEWRYGDREEYRRVRGKYGHAGFLALRLIERNTLKDLHRAWGDVDKVRRDVGLSNSWDYAGANRSPYLRAEDDLKRRLIDLEVAELDVIAQHHLPPIESGSPETPQEARQKAIRKMERDLPFSVVKEKYDAGILSPSIFREIHAFTVDPKTGIQFITQRGFQKRGNNEGFESWGSVGVSGFGPDGEIYYLTPQHYGPAYSTKSGEVWDKFKPFYRGKATYSGVAPSLTNERQIEIWEAYCRAECDIEATKDDFRKDSDWRYNLEEIYWGDQMADMERFKMLRESLKTAKLLKDADTTEFGKVRLGIRIRQSNVAESDQEVIEEASEQQLRQTQELFDTYWQNPQQSKLFVDKGAGYIVFVYPHASSMNLYPDDYGKTIKVRLSRGDSTRTQEKGKREILIRDAYDADTGSTVTGYLKVDWDKEGNWRVERGRHSHTTDAYFLQPEETRNSLTHKDAETVLLTLGLLSQPKQKRG